MKTDVKRFERFAATAGLAVLVAASCGGAALAAEGRPAGRSDPAVSTGSRTMGADELARAGRAVGSTPAVTIYESRLPDGTLELSDRPPGGATGTVERRSYGLSPQDAATRQRAEAERLYWRQQADAFERRQRARDREAERARRERPATIVVTEVPRRAVYHGYGWLPPEVVGPVAGPVIGRPAFGDGSGVYTSSPGVAQGRGAGFIGSGFGTAR